jgi:23S rRNA pseudouridine2605 synthase
MRINKYVALALGVARRAADELIMDSAIKLNGKPAKNGQDVDEKEDLVEYITDKGTFQKLKLPQSGAARVVLMYKTPKIVTSHEREGGNKTIYDILPEKYQQYKFAGRLDLMSEGLLVLSNDGGVVQTLTHPRYGHSKKYIVVTERKLQPKELDYLSRGIEIDGYMTQPAKLTPLSQSPKDYRQYEFLGINIHQPAYIIILGEGRNQQIRKMMFAINTKVKRLIRVEFGKYQLDAKMLKGALVELPWKEAPMTVKKVFAKKETGKTDPTKKPYDRANSRVKTFAKPGTKTRSFGDKKRPPRPNNNRGGVRSRTR